MTEHLDESAAVNEKLELVQTIDTAPHGTVFTTARKTALTLAVITFLVVMFGGVYLAAEGGVNLFGSDIVFIKLTAPQSWAAMVLGVVFTIVGAYILLYAPQMIPAYVYENKIRKAIANRPDALFRHDDPDSIYVKWAPREQWHQIMLDDAADVGLLLIDRNTNTLMFEGDSYRHVVPGDIIVGCKTEFGGNANEPFTLVVLDVPDEYVNVPELCYEYKQLRGMFSRFAGRRSAEALKQQVDVIVGRG